MEKLVLYNLRSFDKSRVDNPKLICIGGMQVLSISDYSPNKSPINKDKDHRFRDMSEYLMLPLFIDAHLHIGGIDSILAQYPSDYDLEKFMENARLTINGAVYWVRDCGCPDIILDTLKKRCHKELGLRIISSGRPITTPKGHMYPLGIIAISPSELKDAVKQIVDSGADFIKVCASGGGLTPSSDPLSTQYSSDQLKVIVEEASRYGKKVAAHAHATESIVNCIDAGVNSIEHCSFFANDRGHNYRIECMERMKEKGIFFVGTILEQNYSLSTNVSITEQRRKELGNCIRYLGKIYRDAINLGVPFVLATDAWGLMHPSNRFGGFLEMVGSAVRDYGLSPEEVLNATLDTPSVLLKQFSAEYIKDDSKDLMIVSKNFLREPYNPANIACVVSDGVVRKMNLH